MKAFISYSHRDRAALERLHTHLAVLRSDGRLDEWFDREILAGEEVDFEIEERLESSELFLLLVSPDFLASDYCVKREMKRALERHRSGDARVVPIVIEPCDWASTALRNLKALPQDGRPVSEWTNENNAFLDVVQELRRMLDAEDVPYTVSVILSPYLGAVSRPAIFAFSARHEAELSRRYFDDGCFPDRNGRCGSRP